MSVDKLVPKNTIFDMKMVTRNEAYAPIAPQLARFEGHRDELLDHLRTAHQRGLEPETFNEARSWDDLMLGAKLYFRTEIGNENTIPPAERFNRLRRLGRTIARARALADRTMQEDIGWDLYRGWFAGTKLPLPSAHTTDEEASSPARVADELKIAVKALATLEDAAFTAAAANALPPKSGRPPLLPCDCIQGLARVYRNHTGLKPGRGSGPFADFVSTFIKATHTSDFEFAPDSVVGAIQNAHHQHTLLRKRSFFDD